MYLSNISLNRKDDEMYISEFVCGVISTIGVELALIIVYAIYTDIKKK